MIDLAVFDCDGTLVDSQSAIVGAMDAAFKDAGIHPPPAAAVRRVIGLSLDRAISTLYPVGGPREIDRLSKTYCEAFAAQRAAGQHHDPLYPGVVEALDALRGRGWLLGVATGKSTRGLLATLERHGLRDRFVTLQTPDTCRGKPDPHMVECAMAEVGASPQRTVVIGDTVFDIGMARAAGAFAVGVSWGYHVPHELTAAGAHRVLETYMELPGAAAELVTPSPAAMPVSARGSGR